MMLRDGADRQAQGGRRLAQVADRHFENRLALFPLSATEDVGDPRFEGALEIEISPEHRARQREAFRATLSELQAIQSAALSPADQLTYQLLEYDADRRLHALAFPSHLMPLNQLDGVPLKLAQWAGGQGPQPFKTVANYDHFLQRLKRLPAWDDQAIANMREGMKTGILRPRAIVERTLPQLQALATTSLEESPFYAPIQRFPATFSQSDRDRLSAEYRTVLTESVLPAQARLYHFVKEEYLPAATNSAGLGALPGGRAWYQFAVRYNTTTRLTADEIHAIGLREVARIRAEMEKVKVKLGYSGSLTEFLKSLNTRPEAFPYHTEDEFIARYQRIYAQVAPQIPAFFNMTPKAPLEIRAVDKLTRDTAPSYYLPPAADGSRPGVFYAAVPDPRTTSIIPMVVTFVHEGVPGHHMQMALQQELRLPRFRRFEWYEAYGEGWGLYAEDLGEEMGLYDDPYAYLGRLQFALWRAVRLVADTGIHSNGWTREQSIQYMMDTEGKSEDEARRATERYMVLPGQALAYKIGELKILELRERARRELGNRFDLRAFHDEILKNGPLPLDLLESRVNAWVGLPDTIRNPVN
jgi:uncharacterized protein (DUF885 family)